MTGPLILNSKAILIPVLGQEKTTVLQKVINTGKDDQDLLPSAYILSHAREATVFTDSKVSIE